MNVWASWVRATATPTAVDRSPVADFAAVAPGSQELSSMMSPWRVIVAAPDGSPLAQAVSVSDSVVVAAGSLPVKSARTQPLPWRV